MKFRDRSGKFCVKCGAGLYLNDRRCSCCGAKNKEVNAPSGKFAFWGFVLPPVGLVLYFSYHYRLPRKANSAAKGALLSTILLFSAAVLLLGFKLITGLLAG